MHKNRHLCLLLLMLTIVVSIYPLARSIFASGSTERSTKTEPQQPASIGAPIPQKWEYRSVSAHSSRELEREANALGQQGFEIVHFQFVPGQEVQRVFQPATFEALFKRPKP